MKTRREYLAPLVAVILAALLVAAAFVVPHLGLGIVTPLINSSPRKIAMYAETAPIFGWWNAHVGWGTVPAVLIAVAAVLWGPALARRLPWRALTLTTWATSAAWAFSLAMVDGWYRGFTHRLEAPHEYLRQVPDITDIGEALRTFARRIPDFQPDSWITHVSGHPPGALLTFVWLDRLGLGGGAWAATFVLVIGSSTAAAIVIAVRALADEQTARRAAPFVAVAPTAIWVAVSADGYFAAVAAWGIALLALAVHRTVRLPVLAAVAAGLLLGWGIFLNYGLGLMALPAVAVLCSAREWRWALRVLGAAAVAAALVAAVFWLTGFFWFDGYHAVQHRYWQGIALNRPFQYWGWANLASVVCAVGLGTVAGLTKVFSPSDIRARSGIHLVVLGALAAILCADLSMLSKAEVERIWLPFTVWLTAAPALLPARSHRWWLALNVIGALVLNHVILTNW
ncbi:hypothetical protein [Mycolicibacterium palauense]|uniref:hypothetical protein n=1 Tax=Mycolicibacterium palauense TaxID=2034511 RepID=UPI001FEB801D|nr:hypothetical protein [Mycolicibacterium palauense]